MAVEVCPQCTCRFAVGLLRCPQCSTAAPLFADRMKETTMPRITVAGGPSNPDAQPGEPGYLAPAEPAPQEVEPLEVLEGKPQEAPAMSRPTAPKTTRARKAKS